MMTLLFQRAATATAAGDTATVKATAVTVIVPMLDGPHVKPIVPLGTNVGLIVRKAIAPTLEEEFLATVLFEAGPDAKTRYGISRCRRYRASLDGSA